MKPLELINLMLVTVAVTLFAFFRCKSIFKGEWTCPKCGYSTTPEPAPIRSISPEAEALARYVEEHY